MSRWNISYDDVASHSPQSYSDSSYENMYDDELMECFQPETWNFSFGKLFDESVEQELLDCLKPDYIRGLTLLGGVPFEPENQRVSTGLQ